MTNTKLTRPARLKLWEQVKDKSEVLSALYEDELSQPFSLDEVAEMVGLNPATIKRYERNGKIQVNYRDKPHRKRVFTLEDVEAIRRKSRKTVYGVYVKGEAPKTLTYNGVLYRRRLLRDKDKAPAQFVMMDFIGIRCDEPSKLAKNKLKPDEMPKSLAALVVGSPGVQSYRYERIKAK